LSNSELKERLADAVGLLRIKGIGAGRYKRLIRAFGNPTRVFEASISEIESVSGISRTLASEIKQGHDPAAAREIAARIVQVGWSVAFLEDDHYPHLLQQIHDAPPILFWQGEPIENAEGTVAIVGTRNATEKGRIFARKLAMELAQAGICVVSGMAEGIDAAAHRGALDSGGRTAAVWGTSLDIVYPPANRQLAEEIRTRGVVYSEYLPGTRPDRSTFPERNRVISGLSSGVVVVEAGQKSGALITAETALSQGRELFAVPGSPDARMSLGANELIRSGARLTTSVEDIFSELPRLKGEVAARRLTDMSNLTDAEKNIANLLVGDGLQLDQLSRSASLPIDETMELLLALELKGIVKELAGKRFILSDQPT